MSPDPVYIKKVASELDFMSCGITDATFLEREARGLESWLKKGYHGKMKWMENHFDKRLNPSLLVPDAKSVISLLFNYYPDKIQEEGLPKIAKYAYGTDYHYLVKERLRELVEILQEEYGDFIARVFVDSAPVMERALAAMSGLGWIGKHSLLLTQKVGSFFFIAQIISDLKIPLDGRTTDHCGTCTACIDACPTDAIVEEKVVDSNKCISYLTIELKEEIPNTFKDQMENWVFGCDICQDVCPWNRFSKPHEEPLLEPFDGVLSHTWNDWEKMTSSTFKKRFGKSVFRRSGYRGFLRNLTFSKPPAKNGAE